MNLRRSVLIGVLGAGLAGTGYLISAASAQDAPPATQPSTRPARDPMAMMFRRMSRNLENLDGITDDQKQKIDALFADTTAKLNDILTDDQKQQLRENMMQMMQRGRNGGGWGNRGGGGGGGGAGGGGGGNNAGGGGGNGGAPGQ